MKSIIIALAALGVATSAALVALAASGRRGFIAMGRRG